MVAEDVRVSAQLLTGQCMQQRDEVYYAARH